MNRQAVRRNERKVINQRAIARKRRSTHHIESDNLPICLFDLFQLTEVIPVPRFGDNVIRGENSHTAVDENKSSALIHLLRETRMGVFSGGTSTD